MTFGAAAFGEDAFGEPAGRVGQPAVQGAVSFSAALDLAPDGLQVDAPFVDFAGSFTIDAAGIIARQGAVSFAGALTLRADGDDLATRLLTDNAAMPVWTVEMQVFRAR